MIYDRVTNKNLKFTGVLYNILKILKSYGVSFICANNIIYLHPISFSMHLYIHDVEISNYTYTIM